MIWLWFVFDYATILGQIHCWSSFNHININASYLTYLYLSYALTQVYSSFQQKNEDCTLLIPKGNSYCWPDQEKWCNDIKVLESENMKGYHTLQSNMIKKWTKDFHTNTCLRQSHTCTIFRHIYLIYWHTLNTNTYTMKYTQMYMHIHMHMHPHTQAHTHTHLSYSLKVVGEKICFVLFKLITYSYMPCCDDMRNRCMRYIWNFEIEMPLCEMSTLHKER